MEIPHDVQERVRKADGSIRHKEGEPAMHAVPQVSSDCPKCSTKRDCTFRRQGTVISGAVLIWYEFKCFTCRVHWVEIRRVTVTERLSTEDACAS